MTGHERMAEQLIAILGGRGMLGSDLAQVCKENRLNFRVLDLPEFDITNLQHLQDIVGQAEIIINCAAYTNVDKAETEVDLAYQVNAAAVGLLGSIARDSGRWILHISTDFVFNGKLERAYLETDATNPINSYGKTKLEGEQLLADSGCEYCIIRTEWTYGRGGNNFITKLISLEKQVKALRVVDDQIGAPTATSEIAKVLCKLLQKKPRGIFHFAASGYASRFEVAKFVFEKLGISANLSNCKSSEYSTPAQRPLNSRLDCRKIQAILDENIKHWQEPLGHFLKSL
jgi:dTDP-4-dehydrorhamnose reductase